MSKRILISILLLLSIIIVMGCSKKKSSDSAAEELVIYTYDSFCSEWGPGPELEKMFTQRTGIPVRFVDCGDGGQLLGALVIDKTKKICDVAIGLDNNLAKKAFDEDLFIAYKPQNANDIIPANLSDALSPEWFLTPFDYSHFAIIYDTQSKVTEPKSLSDLTKAEYKKGIILMDPRTSTPGLGFASWTVSVFGDAVIDYWKTLKPNILTMAPGWSSGYGLFTAGEAPLVISYTTSPAYHLEYENSTRYKALEFEDGHPIQIEGAGILKTSKHKENAKKFMDLFISDDAQFILSLTQWMYPANKNVSLPESYKKAALIPHKTIHTDAQLVDSKLDEIKAAIN